ncbi:MAG: cupin domain-containing protein [Acutalibacteraceae bacterium]
MRKSYMTNMRIMNNANSSNDIFSFNIEDLALKNQNFIKVMWTGKHMQLTLMSINPGSSIGLEVHPDTDQILKIECGTGQVLIGKSKDRLSYQKRVKKGDIIIVPAGMWHNVINLGRECIKLYSMYAPPAHKSGMIHKTKQDAKE